MHRWWRYDCEHGLSVCRIASRDFPGRGFDLLPADAVAAKGAGFNIPFVRPPAYARLDDLETYVRPLAIL
jgi:hypothetical protein